MIDKIPPPLPGLKSQGKKFYNELGEYLVSQKLLYQIDTSLIYQAASWWDQYLIAIKGINDHGPTQTSSRTGLRVSSPEMNNMKAAQASLNVLFNKLGVGEQARQKLQITDGAGGHDSMDDV